MLLGNLFSNRAKIYCHDMNTPHPREYLTLPTGTDENFSYTSGGQDESQGRVSYSKVRLDVHEMHLFPLDWTFADDSAFYSGSSDMFVPMLGKAGNCGSLEDLGKTKINFSGTGFEVPRYIRWVGFGYGGHNTSAGVSRQVVYLECRGGCGGCIPQAPDARGSYAMQPRTYFSLDYSERVMPVEYDSSLDPNPCAF